MQAILHLSIPVRDLDEARAFYVDTLGCRAARARAGAPAQTRAGAQTQAQAEPQAGFMDVWFYGMQVTLQHRPDEVARTPAGGSRHFGVTVGRDEFDAIVAGLEAKGARFVSPVRTDDEGLATEQTKAKVADPSGNVIEIKTYRDVDAALEIGGHDAPEAVAHGN